MTKEIYRFKARIERYIDADTLEVHPLVTPPGINLRIRLKDAWIVENEEDPEEHARILAEQKTLLGDVGDHVWVTNTRHHWTWGRLESRLDAV